MILTLGAGNVSQLGPMILEELKGAACGRRKLKRQNSVQLR